MKKLILSLNLIVLLVCTAKSAKYTVLMTDQDRFSPASLTINQGDTVVWKNNDSDPHTSTSGPNCTATGMWNSGAVAPGASFSFKFVNGGTYDYHCSFHCAEGMVGTITVNDAQVNATTAAAFRDLSLKAFPNPFAENMQIRFDLLQAEKVGIEIRDAQGKVVYSIPEETASAGEQNFMISGHQLERGLFFCQIVVGGIPVATECIVKMY